jgi:peptide/nickel transport system substrate-binding protein
MMTRRAFSTGFMIAIIACLLLLTAAWAQQPRSGGTLRVAWESEMTGFDPHWSPGIQVWYMVGNLFNSLVTIDEHLNYIPELAESWEAQENGKVYVFRLRQGVKFHDGTDFDAAAVAWNFERIMDPEEKAFAKPFFEIVESVEPLDVHTVKFTLKYPTQTFLPTLAVYRVGFLIKAPSTYKTWGGKMRTCIRPGRARLNWPGGSRTRSSCWRRTPTISSQGSLTWTASSTGS